MTWQAPDRVLNWGCIVSVCALLGTLASLMGSLCAAGLEGAKTYDRLVGYCEVNGEDFGAYMMNNSSCKVWEKYDVWDRY